MYIYKRIYVIRSISHITLIILLIYRDKIYTYIYIFGKSEVNFINFSKKKKLQTTRIVILYVTSRPPSFVIFIHRRFPSKYNRSTLYLVVIIRGFVYGRLSQMWRHWSRKQTRNCELNRGTIASIVIRPFFLLSQACN